MRAAYNWVSIWAGKWMWLYVVLWAVGLIAWLRVRSELQSRNEPASCWRCR